MRHRVFTYITQNRKLLVFDHLDYPDLAPQIPGGTRESGESPKEAAIREAQEETGLSRIRLIRSLGDFRQDLSAYGKNESIHAWFYHLELDGAAPSRWQHEESDPHDGQDPIKFELYWVPLDPKPPLGELDLAKFDELRESLNNVD